MKNLPKIFLSIISIVLVLVTSCVEERAGMEQPSGNLPSLVGKDRGGFGACVSPCSSVPGALWRPSELQDG